MKKRFPSLTKESPWKSLIKMAVSVFCAETCIMLLFLVLPKLPDLVETFLDSTLLSVLIAPALYFFIYRPLVKEISERIQIEVELRQSQAQLEQKTYQLEETLQKLQQTPYLIQAEKMTSLGRLVAGIAHEINNPTNFIHGNLMHVQEYANDLLNCIKLYQKYYPEPNLEIRAEIDRVDLEFLQQDLRKMLNSMKIGTERIRQIVLSLRNFSRVDEADIKEVDIHAGIESTLVILQHRLKGKTERSKIEVIKNYGNLPLVECFPGQLNQVFMNILVNAIDAIEEANIKLTNEELSEYSNRITISTSVTKSDWIEITIVDNGTGIPEDIQQKIFNPFFTTKPVGKGTGLGMSISYQIITEKHGGQLKWSSVPGKGTKFVIQIPIRQTACAV